MTETKFEPLGERMKRQEYAYRTSVPSDDYLLLRLDGRAFHTYTRGLQRPYDADLMNAMDATMEALCSEIDGVKLGFCQSDEISLVITNWKYGDPNPNNPDGLRVSQPWLGGVVAKILSISAALASVTFNEVRTAQGHKGGALFDSRLWTIPQLESYEVRNYLLWRQRDCIKNSVTMAAQTRFSHRQLHGVNTEDKIDMLAASGTPWTSLPLGFRHGRICARMNVTSEVTYVDKRSNKPNTIVVDRTPFMVREAPLIGDWVSYYIPSPKES